MKILYVAGRWDPRLQDEYSGNDFGAYNTLKNQPESDVFLVGPFDFQFTLLERVLIKLYSFFSPKRLFKYSLQYPKKCAEIIKDAIVLFQPDIIFSKYSAPLVEVDFDLPLVYMCDSIVPFSKEIANEFAKASYRLMENWERRVISKADRVITFSQANANLIVSAYKTPEENVFVFPIPASVPENFLPDLEKSSKELSEPLHLLFVGKRPYLRGLDIAVELVKKLNSEGVRTNLRVVGMSGKNEDQIEFMGVYNKEQPEQLKEYFANFHWAHLLIHPSRFHSAGIVITEAASFGVPAITNDVGGLATTVLDNETGLVLKSGSTPTDYVAAIKSLIQDKSKYKRLSFNARRRFDSQLNWKVAGNTLYSIVKKTVNTNSEREKS